MFPAQGQAPWKAQFGLFEGRTSGRVKLSYWGRSMEVICQELLGAVLGPNDRQGQIWSVNVSWFRDVVCGVLEEYPTPQRLEQYARGYIMKLIGGFYS
ncbi:hypothetical protein PIB30_054362 [Stylosanthes scabra]|uniref:Uncharacterized protein n=1 Tax=Stylosanthes scabra TaxID=79078 RepID=A0ABU6ZHI1_9FABA|nr:hypothetical protein [Stylosanthes scabra]